MIFVINRGNNAIVMIIIIMNVGDYIHGLH